ncbi:peptidylprolyl isomerase [Polynucleobacter wuianus]|nr:peptidylprolyl isomerase [Polynucleobacter wuianus]
MNSICKALLLLAFFIFINSAGAQNLSEPQAALASVNGVKLTTAEYQKWLRQAIADGAPETPELRNKVFNDLVTREAIAQDIKKTKLLERDNNAFKLELAQSNALQEIWFAEYFKAHPLTDAQVRAEYERQVTLSREAKNSQEYQISQIVVTSEDQANEFIRQLKNGTNFESLAKQKSIDQKTASMGGMLGWVLPSQLTPPINLVVPNLLRGQITQNPIQIGVYWHVIKVDDIRPFVMPSFDQAKVGIAQSLVQQRRQDALANLMKNVKVAKVYN